MPLEMLTYADLAHRLKVSPEAARALAKRLRLPRSRSNDGKALVRVDLSEIQHKALPARSPGSHQEVIASLKAKIETLQAEVARLEATATGHRADFERERDRADRLVAEVLKATADTMAAKEATARLEGELAALRPKPWWKRMARAAA
jgi:multidrug resistance efflux pump